MIGCAARAVADYKAPSSLRAIEAFKDDAARDHLLRFGRMLTGSEADAEDLLADAMESVCDPEKGRPWGERGTFRTHMRVVMTDLAKRKGRSAYARRSGVGRPNHPALHLEPTH